MRGAAAGDCNRYRNPHGDDHRDAFALAHGDGERHGVALADRERDGDTYAGRYGDRQPDADSERGAIADHDANRRQLADAERDTCAGSTDLAVR